MTELSVILAGRPNTGKSTLFNRLARKRLALATDTPGMTRDWREIKAEIAGQNVTLIDTAGWVEQAGFSENKMDEVAKRAAKQSEQLLDSSDVIFFMVDATKELTALDQNLADYIRKTGKPVLLLANKAESEVRQLSANEASRLGLGEPVAISALHGTGLGKLDASFHNLVRKHDILPPEADARSEIDATPPQALPYAEREKPLKLAILGRPNTGKSTLFNRLLGIERTMTGPEAGVTRDAVEEKKIWKGRELFLYDTAGLRRRRAEKVEKLAAGQARHILRHAHIVAVMTESLSFPVRQDLRLIEEAALEGRGVMLLVNKWDKVKDHAACHAKIKETLEKSFPDIGGIPVITLSALEDASFDVIFQTGFQIYELWQKRIPTGPLNQWLAQAVLAHPPPIYQGRRIKLRYITQIAARPPRFALFASHRAGIPENYQRYLASSLRHQFNWPATPLRFFIRKGDNPYDRRQNNKNQNNKAPKKRSLVKKF